MQAIQSKQSQTTIQGFNAKNKFINLLFVNGQLIETTFKKTILFYIVMGLIFLILSFLSYGLLSNVQYYQLLYYDPLTSNILCQTTCKLQERCKCQINITEDIQPPIYIMYKVGNFYQNHRRYVQSRNREQLAGQNISFIQAKTCSPYTTNQQMGKSYSYSTNQTISLDPQAIASPCGAIAKSFFNDTFQLRNSKEQIINISQQGISWQGDKGTIYKKAQNSQKFQWINPQDQHFIVWMRTSGLPNFSKLWGIINQTTLVKGKYNVYIQNNYNSTQNQGKRYFIITNSSIFGGRNISIGTVLLLIGIMCLIGSVFFWQKWKKSL